MEGRGSNLRSVGVLGATGLVGQRFIQRLQGHPWFRVVAVAASERSAGLPYHQACQWLLPTSIPDSVADLIVQPCCVNSFVGVDIVFSALDSSVAGHVETAFAAAGFAVFTNAANHRMNDQVPILVPFVNPAHLDAVLVQRQHDQTGGFVVANANCSSTGLAVALQPLEAAFGIESVFVTTMQAISGAGYPGISAMDIIDNVIPLIKGEEAKLESEPLKILGEWDAARAAFVPSTMTISAHCNRVAVRDGHMACVSVRLSNVASVDDVRRAFSEFQSPIAKYNLPSAPAQPVVLTLENDRPQPLLDREAGQGFTVTVGRVRLCGLFHVKFVCLSHNTVLGAAGGSILNAELAVVRGLV